MLLYTRNKGLTKTAVAHLPRGFRHPRELVRVIAFHLVGQPKLRQTLSLITRLAYSVFFGARPMPVRGGYRYFGQEEIDKVIECLLDERSAANLGIIFI